MDMGYAEELVSHFLQVVGYETTMIRRIPIVCPASCRRLELMSRIRLIVIDVWGNMFISVRTLRPYPLHIFSIILLKVHYWVRPIATAIRLPTFFRGVTASAIVTTIILTIRPTLTLSMPPTTRMMILLLPFILDGLSRQRTSIVTLSILILSLRPLILLLWSSVVSLV